MFLDFNKKNIRFNLIDTNFISIFTESETKYLVDKYYANSFNSASLRLENIDFDDTSNFVTINLSKTDFYSLLTSNILYSKEITVDNKIINSKVKYLKNQDVNDFNVLSKENFSNNLAISVMIEDKFSKKILVKRSSKVVIGNSLVSVAVTGAVDYLDILDKNPIFKSVKRELKEELGIVVSGKNINLDGIYIGPIKLQPIALCSVKLDVAFEELNLCGEDTEFEVDEIHIVTDQELEEYLKYPMTEASKFQIQMHINRNN